MRAATAIFLLLSLPLSAAAGNKTIYGDDSRLDFFEVTNGLERAAMMKAVSIFRATALEEDGDGFKVKGSVFGSEARRLCPGQRFFEQRGASYCSGTLIGPDLVLTAGHCMGEKEKPANRCDTARFVFGFAVERRGEVPERVSAADVYSCSKVEIYSYDGRTDFAVVRLDRAVSGRTPANIYTRELPAEGRRIFTVGGPYGLPLKVLNDATVRAVEEEKGWFRTNLDSSGGNSGGGVFSSLTGLLLGVHTASFDPDLVEIPLPAGHGLPETDARVKEGKCKVITRLDQDGGRGKKAYGLSAIPGLAELVAGGPARASVAAEELPDISADMPDISRFGSLE
ncbi:MAG TPA: hypothetical protein DDW67_02690 [Elusimicrobia bacterium]|nr:hypothetical protein [Elusimicrobiota bacterium]